MDRKELEKALKIILAKVYQTPVESELGLKKFQTFMWCWEQKCCANKVLHRILGAQTLEELESLKRTFKLMEKECY